MKGPPPRTARQAVPRAQLWVQRRAFPITADPHPNGDAFAANNRSEPADPAPAAPAIDIPRLMKALTPYRAASNVRGAVELAITAAPLLALWIATVLLVRAGLWFGLILTIPAGALLLRLFLIQHDCGHGSFFRRRKVNTWVGRAIGVLTLTPYEFWRRAHAQHHATTGNLDKRGLGDVDTLTVAEYRQLSAWARLKYRMYRSPIVLFGLGPAFQFLLRHRIPAGLTGDRRLWVSAMTTNVAIAMLSVGLIWLIGVPAFLLVHLPITLIAATIGVWLFYVQHQFHDTVWEQDDRWGFHDAALYGSSHYDLPPVLRWFSANIGVHHVHHLCSTIPFYRMQSVLRAFPELQAVSRLGVRESLGAIRLTLWDEDARRLISFKEARAA
jgi:omega-6 fatty acid desaturase (delta-12 desaturase)